MSENKVSKMIEAYTRTVHSAHDFPHEEN